MSKNLHSASGAFKRKLKKAKDVAVSKSLEKTPNFFITSKKPNKLDFKANVVGERSGINELLVPKLSCSSESNLESSSLSNERAILDDKDKDSIMLMHNLSADSISQIHSTSSLNLPDENVDFDLTDPNRWGPLTDEVKDIIIKNLPKHLSKITDCDFSKSKRVYSDEITRYANKSMLFTRMKNGQLQKREWLMYSHSKGCFYCVPCTLFHNESINCDTAFTNGFNDWKNASRLLHHEKSAAHRNNTLSFVKRGNVHGRIDSALHQQYMKEVEYWRKVLSHVLHVIKFLGSRGLALRGSNVLRMKNLVL